MSRSKTTSGKIRAPVLQTHVTVHQQAKGGVMPAPDRSQSRRRCARAPRGTPGAVIGERQQRASRGAVSAAIARHCRLPGWTDRPHPAAWPPPPWPRSYSASRASRARAASQSRTAPAPPPASCTRSRCRSPSAPGRPVVKGRRSTRSLHRLSSGLHALGTCLPRTQLGAFERTAAYSGGAVSRQDSRH